MPNKTVLGDVSVVYIGSVYKDTVKNVLVLGKALRYSEPEKLRCLSLSFNSNFVP